MHSKSVDKNKHDYTLTVIDKIQLGLNDSLFTCKYDAAPDAIALRKTLQISNGPRLLVLENFLSEIPTLILVRVKATESDLQLITKGTTGVLI